MVVAVRPMETLPVTKNIYHQNQVLFYHYHLQHQKQYPGCQRHGKHTCEPRSINIKIFIPVYHLPRNRDRDKTEGLDLNLFQRIFPQTLLAFAFLLYRDNPYGGKTPRIFVFLLCKKSCY